MSSLDISNENNQINKVKEQFVDYLNNENKKKDSIIKKISKDENKYLDLDFLNDAKFKKGNLAKAIFKKCIKINDKLELDKTENKVRRKDKPNESLPAFPKNKKINFIFKIYRYYKKIKHKKICILLILIIIIFLLEKTIHKGLNINDEKEVNCLNNKFNSFINDLPIYENTHETNKIIFWCWLQGIERAPKLALANLNSIRKFCNDFKLIIIDDSNIDKYVNIPPYIMQKYKNQTFTKTHFSDILRLELLIKYGGTWIDSSVLITNYDSRFFNKDLFFFGEKSDQFVGSSWFITSDKNNPILRATLDLLYEYWRKYNFLCNYFLFHIFFKYTCEKYQKDYNNVLFFSNNPPHELQYILEIPFNETRYKIILNKVSVHKLTIHKSNFSNNSFYSHIIEEFYPKNNSIL